MVQYRILERRTDGSWMPFGVAYERDGRIVLFAPPWRADRTLAAGSLEDLDARHSPSPEFQWRAVETAAEPVHHPIEWLKRALEPRPEEVSTPALLAAALTRLATVRQDLRERLLAWRERMLRGAVQAEATLRAVLMAGGGGAIEVLPAMSHPSLQARYAGAGERGERGGTTVEGRAASSIVITTDDVPGVRVAVEGDTVVVTFLDWQATFPPLVVLVPADERSDPRAADHIDHEGSMWTARLERVPAGAYLLAVAPLSE